MRDILNSAEPNPYGRALDGLNLDDPVEAFFRFCRERERIRALRESGADAPWSLDPIFQRGRFLNVFREDDRVTKSVLRFCSQAKDSLEALIHAALFARWCNKGATLEALHPQMLEKPDELKEHLEGLKDQPWCNVTAYPVEAVRSAKEVHSRIETATRLFFEMRASLKAAILCAEGDISEATRAINELLSLQNDFPIFMAVVDLAWFRPDVINPDSHVPTGIGAAPYLDLLQRHLGLSGHEETCDEMIALQAQKWPEAKRAFAPIDVEYLSCECRKYYSYVNGTKAFEGKNLFIPGKSPRLLFDVPAPRTAAPPQQTEISVIAGAPCSGKTTLLRALEARGHRVEPETAEVLLEEARARGETARTLRADPIAWQQGLLRRDYDLFESLEEGTPIFTDTSFVETLAFAHRAGLEEGPNLSRWLRQRRYKRVFFLEALPSYQRSEVRLETNAVASQISAAILALYKEYGYEIIRVAPGSVEARVAFIEKRSEAI